MWQVNWVMTIRCVPPIRIGGGLSISWNKLISVSFISLDASLIDCMISNNKNSFYFYCIYGQPIRKLRHVLWERVERIAVNSKGPWLMAGDFDEILNASEKKGGHVSENWSFLHFCNMVQTCKVSF